MIGQWALSNAITSAMKNSISRRTTKLYCLLKGKCTNHCKWSYVKKMRSKQLQPMGSRSSEFLCVPHHNMKQILQTITGFLVTTLDPKCTALQFSHLISPLLPCLYIQIPQKKLSTDLIRSLTNINKKNLQICTKQSQMKRVLFGASRLHILFSKKHNCASFTFFIFKDRERSLFWVYSLIQEQCQKVDRQRCIAVITSCPTRNGQMIKLQCTL